MSYGDYHGPDKPDKGLEGGSCNRTRCQVAPAIWFNHGSRHWYCADCRRDIELDTFNRAEWDMNWRPTKGHSMFETREMMDAHQTRRASNE